MGRVDDMLERDAKLGVVEVAAEVEQMNAKPDDVPADVWSLIQENGRLATERLNELLSSPRFTRLKASDQAKLISLAQNRAYGNPKTAGAAEAKRRVGRSDVTAEALNQLAYRATLPEYKLQTKEVVDAAFEDVEPPT